MRGRVVKVLRPDGRGIAEVADKVQAFDFRQVNEHYFTGWIQQFQLALYDKIGRRDVSAEGVAAHFAYDYLFVRRRHAQIDFRTDFGGIKGVTAPFLPVG